MIERVRDFYDRNADSEWSRLETGLCRVELASTPPEAKAEVMAAGLDVLTYAGVEVFAGGMHELVGRVAVEDPKVFASILAVAPQTSELPQYRDATDHLHLVAHRPT